MISQQRILVALILFSIHSGAIAVAASLSGAVADPSGGVMPGVLVMARNSQTGTDAVATTDTQGSYLFANLPEGRYELRVDLPGFRPFRHTVVAVASDGGGIRVDIQLTLDTQTNTVTVSEAAISVDTTTSESGGRITSKAIAGLPVAGRSFTDLLALEPGVVPTSAQQPNAVVMSGCTSAAPSGDLNPGNLSVSGQRETANGFSVNGSSAQEDFNMGTAIVPNLDSIAELRVATGNFNAEFGNFSGAQVIVTTKSGGDEFHGDVFGFFRNTALDARNYFATDRGRYDRSQFGGTAGGPMGSGKLHFFADYQGTHMVEGVETGLISVPSLANRAGDFSGNSAVLSGTVNGQYWADQLTSKLGYGVSSGEPYYVAGCTSAEQCVFPNEQIPERAWSAPAKALLPYIPQPNSGSDTFSTSAQNETLGDDKAALRLDSNTAWGALAAYYFADGYRMNNPYPTGQGGANVPGFNALSFGRAQLATIGLTTTLNATAVNEFHLGYLRTANTVGQPEGGVGPSLASQGFMDAAGNPSIVPLDARIEGIENVAFNDFSIGVDTTGVRQVNNTYQASDNFLKTLGTHLLKFGVTVHRDQVNINPDAIYNGSFLFQGTETGSDFADFLLGIASGYSQGDSRSFYLRNQYAGLYAQDTWQARRDLTLNYGLRWDVLPPWREKFNQLQTLVPGEQSTVYPGAPEGLVFPGDPGIPSTLAPVRYTDFAPRIGVAYAPDSKTSLRAGYGLFYTALEGLSAGIMSANPPYGYDYTSLAPPLFASPFVAASSGQNLGQPFPSPIASYGATARNPNTSVDWPQYLPVTGVPSFFHGNVTPYSESYTASVEREVARNTILRASYAGSEAHHLLVLISANPGNAALCLSLSLPQDVMPGTATCGPFGESGTYVTRSGQTIHGTRGPFNANFAAVTYQKTIGNSDYNALEVSLRHSSRRLELMAAYTYGKSIDESSSLAEAVNPLNPNLSRAVSAFDMRHNFVATYGWKLIKGWSLSGTTRFTSGFPVTLFNNNDTSLLGTIPNGINNDGVDTPNYTPGNLDVNTNPRNGRAAFNTALFSLPALGQIGTAARRIFYGPGMANFDMALHKTVRLAESKALELRAEAFNVLNHAQFYGPAAVNGNISSPSFGQMVSAAAPRQVQMAIKLIF